MPPPPPALRRWATQELAARMVRAVVRALGPDADIVPVKGVLLGRTVYAHPSERAMTDCDLVLVRPSLPEARRRLAAAGFRLRFVSNDPGIAEVVSPDLPGIGADLHRRPLPVGFGALDAAWLAEGAREDTALFGARVLVPDDRRLLAYLLGHIARDHVYRAQPHTADDVARVLARSAHGPGAFAAAIDAARLRVASGAALAWVRARTDAPAVAALEDALALTPFERARVRWALAALRAWSASDPPSTRARLVARALGDTPGDIARGLVAAAVGSAVARVRRR